VSHRREKASAPVLNTDPKNPTLENNASDVAFETDFRSVYARVADSWLGTSSTQLLGGNFSQTGSHVHLTRHCHPRAGRSPCRRNYQILDRAH